jgi:hypothetical protein
MIVRLPADNLKALASVKINCLSIISYDLARETLGLLGFGKLIALLIKRLAITLRRDPSRTPVETTLPSAIAHIRARNQQVGQKP